MRLAIFFLLASATAHAGDKIGWTFGSGGTVYENARDACEAYLESTPSAGVKYVIDRMESTDAGDRTCWFKNSEDEGKAVTQTLIYRVRRKTYLGTALYRGTTALRRREVTKTSFDLGPGAYYAFQQYVARGHAIAAFLEVATGKEGKALEAVPDGLVYEVDFTQPKDTFDFSTGEPRRKFEAHVRSTLGTDVADRMFNGEVNPILYYQAFESWLRTQHKTPAQLKVVIGPDYRYNEKQVRINDAALIAALDRTSMQVNEARFPQAADVAAALVGHETSKLFERCAGSSRSGSCGIWPYDAGKLIYQRRGWQSVVYLTSAGKAGFHYHLRIGDVLLDGAFTQFDKRRRNDGQSPDDLFVGSREELIQRLDNFGEPVVAGADGKQLFGMYWDGKPVTPVQRLGIDDQSKSAQKRGEPVWR